MYRTRIVRVTVSYTDTLTEREKGDNDNMCKVHILSATVTNTGTLTEE